MQKKVVILGGGVAGLSAAHELVERGFTVEVYEAKAIPGGKARSIPVPNTGTEGPHGRRKDLPGEHGFRFFPRFYKHVVDTMQRIPYGNGGTVVDNLVDTTRVELARFDQYRIVLPSRSPRTLADVRVVLNNLATLFDPSLGMSYEELAFFASRVWQIITSCQERRLGEYEKIGWWEFIGAEERSPAYQKFLGHGITRSLVAAKAQLASTKTIGDIFVQLLFDIVEPGPSSDRVLNGPTNDVWISPWLTYLRSRGVNYHLRAQVKAINCANGRIQSAIIERDGATAEVTGDYYISAVPVERMVPLLTPSIIKADPGLASLKQLATRGVSWMNGMQLYLTHDVPITHGHTIYIDSPWALTSVSQAQFWPEIDLSQYGDGHVRGILSIDISEWDTKGLNGKTAKECTREEVKAEVWEQLKRSLNVGGEQLLKDEYLHAWFLDPDIYRSVMGMDVNEEPLLVNLIDSWVLRPEATTSIPNLFLASDYVRTYTDLATMEGANEAARRAVNGIIEASGVSAPLCRLWNLHEPEVFEPWRAIDRVRYENGLPWDDTLVVLGLSALDLASRAIDLIGPALTAGVESLGTQGMNLADPKGRLPLPGATGTGQFNPDQLRRGLMLLAQHTIQSVATSLAEAESLTGMATTPSSQGTRVRADGRSAGVRSGQVKIIPQ